MDSPKELFFYFGSDIDGFNVFVIDKKVVGDGKVQLDLRARDVKVERRPGSYLLNSLVGRGLSGKDELDRQRSVLLDSDKFIQVKSDLPIVNVGFPSNFENLSLGFRNSGMSSFFELFYRASEEMKREIDNVRRADRSLAEVYNTQSSGFNKMMELYNNMVRDMRKEIVEEKSAVRQLPQQNVQQPSI